MCKSPIFLSLPSRTRIKKGYSVLRPALPVGYREGLGSISWLHEWVSECDLSMHFKTVLSVLFHSVPLKKEDPSYP
jgi:hypothetical protein